MFTCFLYSPSLLLSSKVSALHAEEEVALVLGSEKKCHLFVIQDLSTIMCDNIIFKVVIEIILMCYGILVETYL